MWELDYDEQSKYWLEKVSGSKRMDPEELSVWIESFIRARKTCALATASLDFVRCTPIEYNYVDGNFYLFSEGGLKFRALKDNKNVSLSIFDPFDGFGNLKGLQVQGKAEMIEPFSTEYDKLLNYKNIPKDRMTALPKPMNLIKVIPESYDLLDSKLKQKGVDIRQHYEMEE